jgi:hypothetical protein
MRLQAPPQSVRQQSKNERLILDGASLERRHEVDFGEGDWQVFVTKSGEKPIISMVKDTGHGSIVMKNMFFDPDRASRERLREEYLALVEKDLKLQDQLARVSRERDVLQKVLGDLRQALFDSGIPRSLWNAPSKDARCATTIESARLQCAQEKRALESLLQHCRQECEAKDGAFFSNRGETSQAAGLSSGNNETPENEYDVALKEPGRESVQLPVGRPPRESAILLLDPKKAASHFRSWAVMGVGIVHYAAILIAVAFSGVMLARYVQHVSTVALEAGGNLLFAVLALLLLFSRLLLGRDPLEWVRSTSASQFIFLQCMLAVTYPTLWLIQLIRLGRRESLSAPMNNTAPSPRAVFQGETSAITGLLRLLTSAWLGYDFFSVSWDGVFQDQREQTSSWRYAIWAFAAAIISLSYAQSERASFAELVRLLPRIASVRLGDLEASSIISASADAEGLNASPVLRHAVTVNDVVLLDARGSAALARESTTKKA